MLTNGNTSVHLGKIGHLVDFQLEYSTLPCFINDFQAIYKELHRRSEQRITGLNCNQSETHISTIKKA